MPSDNTMFTLRDADVAPRSARGISKKQIQADNPVNLTAVAAGHCRSLKVLGFVNTGTLYEID